MVPAVIPSADEMAKVSKLLALLDDAGRERLVRAAARRSVSAGEVLCREGEAGDEFFIVLAGTVRVTADDLGATKEIAVLGRGGFFGEMAVLAGQPRSATVEALEPCDLLIFPSAAIAGVLKDYPKVREVLGKVGVLRTEELLGRLAGA